MNSHELLALVIMGSGALVAAAIAIRGKSSSAVELFVIAAIASIVLATW